MPSDTSMPASQIVPVVPMLAPRTAATAAGRGSAPAATNPIIAVVDSDDVVITVLSTALASPIIATYDYTTQNVTIVLSDTSKGVTDIKLSVMGTDIPIPVGPVSYTHLRAHET